MRVLLTGAAGKVGKQVVAAFGRAGIEVVATDLRPKGLPRGLRFERCDLTDARAVHRLLAEVQPDVLVHCAAVVAPVSYAEPGLSEAVNLGGTRHLIDATKAHAPDAFFAFVSSYAVFGPFCPEQPDRKPSDGCRPVDNYGQQKLSAERWLRESGLRQCVLRLGAVMDMNDLIPAHWSYRPFMFMVPLEQPEHGVDVRDVARAIVAASTKQPDGELFLIGGDESWKVPARILREEMLQAMGLDLPPQAAFRSGMDPSVPEGWFYECWMDVRESQRALQFQTIGRAAYMEEMRHRNRLKRLPVSLLRPLILRAMSRQSPYLGRAAISPGRTLLDDLGRVFGTTLA